MDVDISDFPKSELTNNSAKASHKAFTSKTHAPVKAGSTITAGSKHSSRQNKHQSVR